MEEKRRGITTKYTIEEVNNVAEKRGLHLVKNQTYINKSTRLYFYDDNRYKYYLTLGSINNKGQKWFDIVGKINPFSVENIQQYIYNHDSKTKLLETKYISNKEKMELICECGNHYKECWNHIKSSNKIRCPKCGRKRMGQKQTYSFEQINNICEQYGYKLVELVNAHNICIKDEYGYKYKTMVANLAERTDRFNKFSPTNPFCFDNMRLYLKLNDINVEIYEDKKDEKGYITFICPKCHKKFKSKWENVAYGSRRLCDECSLKQSNLEYIVGEYLKSQNIKYICQKRFDDCRNIKPLPFDFYLVDYNVCIEVQGAQHYYEDASLKFGTELEERQRIDKIKEDYCINNNIGYLAIPFWNIYNNRKYNLKFTKQIQDIIGQV